MAEQRIDLAARALFLTDTEISRDRELFKSFDDMPPGLQQWWRDRACRKIDEIRLMENGGYDPTRDM